MRALKAFCLCVFALAFAETAFAQAEEPIWYRFATNDGEVLGHASREVSLRADGRDVVESHAIVLREQRGTSVRVTGRSVFKEDASGAVTAISAVSQSGRFETRTEVRISGGIAEIVKQTPSGRTTTTLPLPAGVRFDDGDGLLPSYDPIATPLLTYENFNIDALVVEQITVEPAHHAVPEGQRVVLRRRYEHGSLTGIARITLDGAGRIIDVAQPMFGVTIHMQRTDRESALAPHPPYYVTPNVMTRSPFRISPAAMQGHIRFRLAFRDGIEFAPPETHEQHVAADGDGIIVDVCGDCGPGMASDAATLADALKPTVWLQSEDARVVDMAESVARLDVTDTRKMEMLARRTRAVIERIDFSGHYSAVDTIERRGGDCTEAAVLLAALGRAAGIPTRVANGFAYSRESYHGVSNAFMPHSWVLAWVDGRWRSFDAALETFDSTHIALTIGDGDARSIAAAGQLASLLRFDTMAEVRP